MCEPRLIAEWKKSLMTDFYHAYTVHIAWDYYTLRCAYAQRDSQLILGFIMLSTTLNGAIQLNKIGWNWNADDDGVDSVRYSQHHFNVDGNTMHSINNNYYSHRMHFSISKSCDK